MSKGRYVWLDRRGAWDRLWDRDPVRYRGIARLLVSDCMLGGGPVHKLLGGYHGCLVRQVRRLKITVGV